MGEKLIEKLKQGALVLSNYVSLEHIDGRVDYLQTIKRKLFQEDALTKIYESIQPQEDIERANGRQPWFHFVKPLKNCGQPKFSSITAKMCDQVLSELHILQVALHMRDLEKTKSAIAELLSVPKSELKPIRLFTVHAAKGGEWPNVLLMDDFPDLCALVCALNWCRSPAILPFQSSATFDKPTKQKLEKALKMHVMQNVAASDDRNDAISYICRALSSCKCCDDFITGLNEELHLYYVAVTRAKRQLFIGVSIQRYRNQFC